MIRLKTLLVTTSLLFGMATVSGAEEISTGEPSNSPAAEQATEPMATGYSTLPEAAEASSQDSAYEGDGELVTDHNEFYKRGFMSFDWQTHTAYVQNVLTDVVIPDYIKRTGMKRPDNPSVDVTAAMITNPYFNDLIVQSRLPGDCKPNGCLVQIYSLVGEVWVKKFQTTTFDMLAKPGDKIGTVLLGLVGNDEVPSKTVIWTGSVFQEL